ncbi:MAG TPA: beta-ketoacyl synthase N-terminal-like domain-containing protein [Steroidobacteraceae bacterium]|jgi:malonyl-ACP decarboxylase
MPADLFISGIGVTTAIGQGQRDFGAALLEGRHAFDVMRRPGRQSNTAQNTEQFLGAEIGELRLPQGVPGSRADRQGRGVSFSAQVALATLEEAWGDAALADVDPQRIGLVVGGSNFQQRDVFRTQSDYAGRESFVSPLYALSFLDTDLGSVCAARFGIQGPCCTVGGASASGQLAVIQAARIVLCGEADVCVAVGALMDLSHWECRALRSLGAMGSDRFATEPALACRPFDGDRDGFIFGEGCAAVVVERAAQVNRRGVRPYATLGGWATVCDANRNPDPSLEGEIRAIQLALAAARRGPEDVNYLNPHGSGSRIGDDTEVAAIRACGLEHAPINATKSIVGHCLSAAGTVEIVATVVQMRLRQLHPTRNLSNPIDPGLRWVGGSPISHAITSALTLSVGFGGINTALILDSCG